MELVLIYPHFVSIYFEGERRAYSPRNNLLIPRDYHTTRSRILSSGLFFVTRGFRFAFFFNFVVEAFENFSSKRRYRIELNMLKVLL